MTQNILNIATEQKEIDLSCLLPSALNSFDATDYGDLKNSIRALGILTPIAVSGPDEDGKYEILSGERRFRAVRELCEEDPNFKSTIPCYVMTGELSKVEKSLIIEMSNLEVREDYNRDEHRFRVVKLFKELSQNDKNAAKTDLINQISQAFKVSPRYGRMYVTIDDRAIPELKAAVEQTGNHINVKIAEAVAKLPPDVQSEFLNRVNAGETPEAVLKQIKAALNSVDDEEFDFTDDYQDDPFSAQMRRGESLDDDTLDDGFDKYFGDDNNDLYKSQANMNIDTTGMFGKMQQSSEKSQRETIIEERKRVSSWINRIMGKLERDERLDPEDEDLMIDISELSEMYYKID